MIVAYFFWPPCSQLRYWWPKSGFISDIFIRPYSCEIICWLRPIQFQCYRLYNMVKFSGPMPLPQKSFCCPCLWGTKLLVQPWRTGAVWGDVDSGALAMCTDCLWGIRLIQDARKGISWVKNKIVRWTFYCGLRDSSDDSSLFDCCSCSFRVKSYGNYYVFIACNLRYRANYGLYVKICSGLWD